MDYTTLALCVLYTATVFYIGKWYGFRTCRKMLDIFLLEDQQNVTDEKYRNFLIKIGLNKKR